MLEWGVEIAFGHDIIELFSMAFIDVTNRFGGMQQQRANPTHVSLNSSNSIVTELCNFSVTSPAPREQWQAIYATDPTSSLQQSPCWIELMCATGGFEDVSRLYELSNGKQLVLPLVKRKGVPNFLAFAESLPTAWGVGGLLSTEPVEAADIVMIMQDVQRAGYLGVSIRPNPLQSEAWAAARPPLTAKVPRCAHVLDLAGGFETVWSTRFSKSKRKQVRRAERADLHVECDTTGRLMPVFYELYQMSLVRWAEQQNEPLWLAQLRANARDPLHKLQAMATALGNKCRVWVAWHQGQPAAALVTLLDFNASPILAAMDKELATRTYASSLIERLSIEDACQAGCRYYDFGETGFNDKLAYNKVSYGAEAMPYEDYHIERLPITQWDQSLRGVVKGLIGFRDV